MREHRESMNPTVAVLGRCYELMSDTYIIVGV